MRLIHKRYFGIYLSVIKFKKYWINFIHWIFPGNSSALIRKFRSTLSLQLGLWAFNETSVHRCVNSWSRSASDLGSSFLFSSFPQSVCSQNPIRYSEPLIDFHFTVDFLSVVEKNEEIWEVKFIGEEKYGILRVTTPKFYLILHKSSRSQLDLRFWFPKHKSLSHVLCSLSLSSFVMLGLDLISQHVVLHHHRSYW